MYWHMGGTHLAQDANKAGLHADCAQQRARARRGAARRQQELPAMMGGGARRARMHKDGVVTTAEVEVGPVVQQRGLCLGACGDGVDDVPLRRRAAASEEGAE